MSCLSETRPTDRLWAIFRFPTDSSPALACCPRFHIEKICSAQQFPLQTTALICRCQDVLPVTRQLSKVSLKIGQARRASVIMMSSPAELEMLQAILHLPQQQCDHAQRPAETGVDIINHCCYCQMDDAAAGKVDCAKEASGTADRKTCLFCEKHKFVSQDVLSQAQVGLQTFGPADSALYELEAGFRWPRQRSALYVLGVESGNK